MKRILFITGTRADYGKIKSLMTSLENNKKFEVFVYVSGMHLLSKYGNTYKEILKDNYKNVHIAYGQQYTSDMSYNLGDVITHLSGYVNSVEPDMIVVHGDRSDALAGAIVGAFNNIIVAHIEGGEISGTIDDSIRHAITKFAHLHFVANEQAKRRLLQMGESESRIFIIGSPDIDVMLSDQLPALSFVKKYYEITYKKYAIFMYHPVTTEFEKTKEHIERVIEALEKSNKKYIVVYPNNDKGTELILAKYEELKNNSAFHIYPSLRFEYFLTLLKNADFIIGNSSAGVRETGIYGVPAIDIGSRQERRYDINVLKNVQHVSEDVDEILDAIHHIDDYRVISHAFGKGDSTRQFIRILESKNIWKLNIQKQFMDMGETN